MAIVKTKVNFQKLIATLEKFFKDLGKDEKLLNDIGQFSLDRIRGFVRSGYSLAGGKKHRLEPLSEKSTIPVRMGAWHYRTNKKTGGIMQIPGPDPNLKRVDKTFFSPTLSNLTFTGQLMKAMQYMVYASKRIIIVGIDDSRRNGPNEKLSNKDVAKHVSDNGRPFLGLDKTGSDRIKKMVQSFIRKEIINQRLRKR